jgi:hypothetical protein
VAFISYRVRLTKVLACASRGEKESKDVGGGVLVESSIYIILVVSTDVNQVGVALFHSLYHFYHFAFPGFPFILILKVKESYGSNHQIKELV